MHFDIERWSENIAIGDLSPMEFGSKVMTLVHSYTTKRTLLYIKTYFLVQQNVLCYQQHALLYTPKSTILHNKMYIIIPQNKFYFIQNAFYCRRILISGTNIHRVTSFCQL